MDGSILGASMSSSSSAVGGGSGSGSRHKESLSSIGMLDSPSLRRSLAAGGR
jgi:hypothetical protein